MSVLQSGKYRITNKQHSLRLDSNEKAAVYGAPANKGTYQIWDLTMVSDSVYTVKSTATGAALDGNASGAIYAINPNGGKYQQWRIVEVGGFYRFTSEETGLRLDCDWGDAEGGAITGKAASESDAQKWVLVKV